MSAVVALLECDGEFRVVVTPLNQLLYHMGNGERPFVVPDFDIDESEVWARKEEIVGRALQHMRLTLAVEGLLR